MTAPATADLRFPVGKFETPPLPLTPAQRTAMIAEIASAPARFRAAVAGLTDAQLDTPYRDGGWTVRQVAHHIPDSHSNAVTRFKLGLTEETPTIKPYMEDRWAMLADSDGPIEPSLQMLDGLHARWVLLLEAMTPGDFARTINHPASGTAPLDRFLALYAWHGRHHTTHVTSLRARMGW